MNKRTRNKPPANFGQVESAAQQVLGPQRQSELTVSQESITVQVALPPPAMMAEYERVRPGTMDSLVAWAESEQAHRRKLESEAQTANIAAQRAHTELQQAQLATQRQALMYQAETVRRSDLVGQIIGGLLCLLAMVAAAYLGLKGRTAVAVALAALPTAAVIQSFRSLNRQEARAKPAGEQK